MAVINTNISATIAQNSLVKNERMMSKAMEQLSTGRRINSASDDAAGLAIASVMTSQVRGLNQAVRNANDAVSMLQTAEGALSEVENMLQRMRELSIQAASDTYTNAQRTYANTEFTELANQIQQINNSTEWNGSALFDGAPKVFQIGNDASTSTMSVTMADLESGGASGTLTLNITAVGAADPGGSATVATLGTNAALNGTALANNVVGESYTAVANINGEDVTVEFTVAGGAGAATLVSAGSVSLNDGTTINIAAGATGITFTNAANGANTLSIRGATNYATSGAGVYDVVSSLSIGSQANASAAITSLETEIANVAGARATFGAQMNRLTYAADNLANEAANTQAARSRVMDADYGTATTELARTQIIQQAGTAMLAQANQLPQTVLSLLQ